MRAYHPKYYFYLKQNDIEAADMTQAVCNNWIESLIQECIRLELSFIVEGTMRKKEVPMKTAEMLHHDGYTVNLVVISTPYEVSLMSLEYRYKELKKLGQPARFTKKESHDEAYQNIESTVEDLVRSPFFKKFFIYTRSKGMFSEATFEAEEKENVLQNFKKGRLPLVGDKKDTLFEVKTNPLPFK